MAQLDKAQGATQSIFPGIAAVNNFHTATPIMVSAVARMQGDTFDAMMKCNIELLDFLRSRCEEDRKFALDVTRSGDPGHIFDAWMGFWGKAIREYTSEAGKLATINSELAGETVRRIAEEAEHIHRESGLAAAA